MQFEYLVLILLYILYWCVKLYFFYNSSYHEVTHNSYLGTIMDIGKNGEYRIYRELRYLEKQGARFLFNVYLPKGNDETVECDVLLITSKGIIVFESKNYSGWIFGDERQTYWTQSLPQGKGRRALKEKFFNPIMQNEVHIKGLKRLLSDSYEYRSIIVFSERCTLKNINVLNPLIQVCKRDHINGAVQSAFDSMPNQAITFDTINELYSMLYPYSQVDDTTKKKHIDDIINKYK